MPDAAGIALADDPIVLADDPNYTADGEPYVPPPLPRGIPVQKLTLTDGSEIRATHITVTNEAGSRRIYHDAAASATKGERRLPIETVLRYSADMADLGQRVAAKRAAPDPYVDSISTSTAVVGVNLIDLLRLQLYDRINVMFVRPWTGVLEIQTLEIIHRAHDGDAGGDGVWRSTFHLRPA